MLCGGDGYVLGSVQGTIWKLAEKILKEENRSPLVSRCIHSAEKTVCASGINAEAALRNAHRILAAITAGRRFTYMDLALEEAKRELAHSNRTGERIRDSINLW